MIRVPLYAMEWSSYKKYGLIFPHENESEDFEPTVYVIPRYINGKELREQIDNVKIYFPFDQNSEYLELESTIKNSSLIFNPPGYPEAIEFTIDFDRDYIYKGYEGDFKYVGKYTIPEEKNSFVIVNPKNVYYNDKLYKETKGLFIGLTPKFGPNQNDFNFI